MIENLKTFLTGLVIFSMVIIGFILAVVIFLYLKDKFITDVIKNIAVYGWVTFMILGTLAMIYAIGDNFRNK